MLVVFFSLLKLSLDVGLFVIILRRFFVVIVKIIVDKVKFILLVCDFIKYYLFKFGVVCYIVGYVKVVDGVSFNFYFGEIFGVVGEFGCGKFMLGCLLVNFELLMLGMIIFEGCDVMNFMGLVMCKLCCDI